MNGPPLPVPPPPDRHPDPPAPLAPPVPQDDVLGGDNVEDDDGADVHAPAGPGRRPFRGFVSGGGGDVVLLQAICDVNPFERRRGNRRENGVVAQWNRVVEAVLEYDRTRPEGEPLRFVGANHRNARSAWELLLAEQIEYEAQLLRASGIVGEMDERKQLLESAKDLHDAAQADQAAAAERQDAEEQSRVEGQAMRDAATQGAARKRGRQENRRGDNGDNQAGPDDEEDENDEDEEGA
ncbi:hypothetical protein BGZ83_005759, partial [Gryganskiella cystojenkinii]